MTSLGLFKYAGRITGTGDLIADPSDIDGAGTAGPDCGPSSGDYEEIVAYQLQGPNQQLRLPRTGTNTVDINNPQGIVNFPQACVVFDLDGCTVATLSGNKVVYWPAGTNSTDATVSFVFVPQNVGLTEINLITGNISGGWNDGPGADGAARATYWSVYLGIDVGDDGYYTA